MNDKPDPTLDRALRAEYARARLEQIAQNIKEGDDPGKYDDEMNELLGTKMEERDRETEERWEESYRERPQSETD